MPIVTCIPSNFGSRYCLRAYADGVDNATMALQADEYVTAVRTALGLSPPGLESVPDHCPDCFTPQTFVRDAASNNPEMAMVDHIPRCPVRAYATAMHNVVRDFLLGLVKTLTTIPAR